MLLNTQRCKAETPALKDALTKMEYSSSPLSLPQPTYFLSVFICLSSYLQTWEAISAWSHKWWMLKKWCRPLFQKQGAVQGTFYGWETVWAGKKWDFDELRQRTGIFLSRKMRCWLVGLLGLRSGWVFAISSLLCFPNGSDPEGKGDHRYISICKCPS